MLNREYKTYKHGIIDTLEDHSTPHGAASRSLGFQTKGDKTELMRGRHLLGTENTGSGRISGIHVGERADGTQVLFKTYARKVKYYDTVTEDFIEISTDFLPADVLTDGLGEDVSFSSYASLAGYQVWLNSPNGTLAKIMTANPGSITDMYLASKNFKGFINIKQNRMSLWQRGVSGSNSQRDLTSPYLSYIDAAAYTTVTTESLGSSGSLTYSGTLAFKGGGARRTCFGVVITDGTETFYDDYNGVLTGSAGGTGTINYTTGEYSVTFNSVAGGAVTADYQWEDSTNTGIADFTKSAPRTAGQGATFRQDDGGSILQAILSFRDVEYCIHRIKTWALTLTATDTSATNLIFRHKVGIPNWRAAVPTGDGIYYVDDVDENEPRLRLLTLDSSSDQVVPIPISLNLDLTGYRFNQAASIEFGDLVLFACRTANSNINNRVIVYDRVWKSLDILPYYASCFAIYNGVLVAGDSGSNNVYELFSGLDDDDSTIENYWEGASDDLQVRQLKKTKRLVLEGEIGPDQSTEVYISYDNAAYTLLGTIDGNGSYVDRSQSVNVGAVTIGRTEIGGGGLSGSIPAYHYIKEFRLDSDKFNRIKIKLVATEIGYFSLTGEQYKDIRAKGNKIPARHRTTI